MPTHIVTVEIGPDPAPRLDKALARDVPEDAHLSRSRLMRLIAEGAVRLNGGPVTDATRRVFEGDAITIALSEAAEVATAPQDIALEIVHEDADLLVVNKPVGMVVHPAPGTPDGTLVNALLHHFGGNLSGVGGEKRPGIVHRIDKDTSGLLVVAKSDRAHHGLAAQFAAHHSIERVYHAICHGVPDAADPRLQRCQGVNFEGDGTLKITTQLARHKTDRQRQAVLFQGGRHAVTRRARCSRGSAGRGHAGRMPPGNRAHPSDPGAYGTMSGTGWSGIRSMAGGARCPARCWARRPQLAINRLPAPGAACARSPGLRASRDG